MKVVQTNLNETEYALLEQYARRNAMTIKDVARQAIRKLVAEDIVHPEDALFSEPPVAKGTGAKDRSSLDHDKYLYGA